MATQTQINQLLKAIADAIIESVEVAGSLGAPAGTLYAAMMAHGFTLQQFEQFMAGLVGIGKLEKRGQLYFVKGAK